jgi:hypothetical protein
MSVTASPEPFLGRRLNPCLKTNPASYFAQPPFWPSQLRAAAVKGGLETIDVAGAVALAALYAQADDPTPLFTCLAGAALEMIEKNELLSSAYLTSLKAAVGALLIKKNTISAFCACVLGSKIVEHYPPNKKISTFCIAFFALLLTTPKIYGAAAPIAALIKIAIDAAANKEHSHLPVIDARLVTTSLTTGGGAIGFMLGGPLGAAAGALATGAIIKVSAAAYRLWKS